MSFFENSRCPGSPISRARGFSCAPGMGDDLVAKVHYRLGSTSLLDKGKGARREAGI